MAYDVTIQDWWTRVNTDKYEDKLTGEGAYRTFLQDTPNLIPNINDIIDGRVNPQQALKFPVLNKNEQTAGTVRTLTINGVEGTSALQSITFGTLTYDIVITPSVLAGNAIDLQTALDKELMNADFALTRKADQLAVAALETAKNLVDDTGGYPLPFSAGVYTASNAQKEDLLNYIPQIMSVNEFEIDQLNIVGSPEILSWTRDIQQFGQFNSENKSLQLAGKNLRWTKRLARGTDNQFSLFAIPEGSLAVIPFIENDARQGIDFGNTRYYTIFMPRLGMNVGVYELRGASDVSGNYGNGFEHAATIKMQLAIDLAFVTPYNSDPNNITNAIHKFVCTIA